jgi:alpha-L-rhamnosidase
MLRDGRFELSVEVPPNTRATVRLPTAQLASLSESGKPLADGNGITGHRQEGDVVVVEIGSGQYRFAYSWVAK